MAEPVTPVMTATLRDNIARLTERQRTEANMAPLSQRLADRITRFTGSMTFVGIHLVLYGTWIAINLGWIPGVPRFDPSFVVLAMEASVEAIFLSTFVLISQNRMAAEADRRADLDLHINLLAEHELTRLAGLIERIAERVGVPVDDAELEEIKRDVAPVEVLDALDARKRAEGLDP
ncbi:DUF1003 domain-containing protein [Sphingomonas sp. DT-204]|uniref:DUF1003 domain-containing protein n=1 Tax=Sphingomonas sp. DT-204 TaxID=3396166 RepID=UPI003F1DA5FF